MLKGKVALRCTKILSQPVQFFLIVSLIIKSTENHGKRDAYKGNFSRRFEWRYLEIDPSSISHRKLGLMIENSPQDLTELSFFLEKTLYTGEASIFRPSFRCDILLGSISR